MGVRASNTTLKDEDDDYAHQIVIGDLERLSMDASVNTAAIATNAADIATNTAAIAANTAATAANTAELSTVTRTMAGFTATTTGSQAMSGTITPAVLTGWSTAANVTVFSTVGASFNGQTFTVPTTGYWNLSATIRVFHAVAAGFPRAVNSLVYMRINGVNFLFDAGYSGLRDSDAVYGLHHAAAIYLSASDTVELWGIVQGSSTDNLVIFNSYWSMHFLYAT